MKKQIMKIKKIEQKIRYTCEYKYGEMFRKTTSRMFNLFELAEEYRLSRKKPECYVVKQWHQD